MSDLSILFLLCVLAVSCGDEKSVTETDTMKAVSLQSEITGVQPMTGIVLWTTHSQRSTDAVSMEYSYLVYKDYITEEGEYDWTSLEVLLEGVASRKHQAIVRFRYVYPGDKESGVPNYIRSLPDYKDSLGISEGRETMFPDWRHEELKRFHLEFYKEFAKRYDKDPRIAFLQTGFGLWAEYHIYDGPRIIGHTFPSKEFQTEFFNVMAEAFDVLPWNISIDAASSEYTPFASSPSLRNITFGLFDDSFMHEGHDGYNAQSWSFFGEDKYKTSPAGGEFSYYSQFDQQHVLDENGMHGRIFEDEVKKFHISYMIGNDQPRYQSMDRIKLAGMACGYRFAVIDFQTNEDSSLVCVRNIGVAPIYKDAFVTVNGIRSSISLRSLMPGQTTCYEIASGGEQPALTIESDFLVSGQTIQYEADL